MAPGAFPQRPANGYRPRGTRERTGFVYVLATTELTHRFKVGFTTNHPLRRLRTIEGGSPVTLRTVGVWKGTRLNEWEAQHLAVDAHVRGEWFKGEALGVVVVWLNANCERVSNCLTTDPEKMA